MTGTHTGEGVVVVNIAIFTFKQRLLSLDMKTKVVQHVPRINISIWHLKLDIWHSLLSIDMKTKVVQHVWRIKLDNLTTGQLDNWTPAIIIIIITIIIIIIIIVIVMWHWATGHPPNASSASAAQVSHSLAHGHVGAKLVESQDSLPNRWVISSGAPSGSTCPASNQDTLRADCQWTRSAVNGQPMPLCALPRSGG